MATTMLYHGSNVEVSAPQIMLNGFYKDFGYGFYLTNMERQAKRWALTKRGASIVSVFSYIEDSKNNVVSFSGMTEEWLEFVVNCRRGVAHSFDIVEGPMADDQIWDYVEDYMDGSITKAAFWELIKFRYPTHQIAFCTEKALEALHFERSVTL